MEKDSEPVTLLTSLFGLVLGPITGGVGVQCSPLSVIGVGGGSSWCVILVLLCNLCLTPTF